MASSSVDLSGLDRLIAHLKKVQRPDPVPLQAATIRIMEEDNRRGLLAGLDKDGIPLERVKYRPKGAPKRTTARQRNNADARKKAGSFGGVGPMAAGLHNNLTSAEYRRLAGPPLIPRGKSSRFITNYRLTMFEDAPLRFGVIGLWDQIVNSAGEKFAHFHFDGKGRLPKRDIRGVRPDGRAKLRKAFIAWAADQIRYKGRKGS